MFRMSKNPNSFVILIISMRLPSLKKGVLGKDQQSRNVEIFMSTSDMINIYRCARTHTKLSTKEGRQNIVLYCISKKRAQIVSDAGEGTRVTLQPSSYHR